MNFLNNFLNIDFKSKFFLLIQRRIARMNKIYFVTNNLSQLPDGNYPYPNFDKYFNYQLEIFRKNKNVRHKTVIKVLKNFFNPKEKINFLDFGGEDFDLYLYLISIYPKINIFVINQKLFNKNMKLFIKKNKLKKIYVLNNLKDINNIKFNFVHFGSSIHYVNNYLEILSTILKKSNGYIYFTGMHFFKKKIYKKFQVKQTNLLPISLFCYFFNINYFIKILKKNSFYLISKKNNPFKKICYKNFAFKINYLDLLFKKNPSKKDKVLF